MSARRFVMIYPGAVDDIGDERGLNWNQRSLLRWLILDAGMDYEDGRVDKITSTSIVKASRLSRNAVTGALRGLADAGVIRYEMPGAGQDGWIAVNLDVLDVIVRRPDGTTDGPNRARRSTRPARRSAGRARRPADRARRSTRTTTEYDGAGAPPDSPPSVPPEVNQRRVMPTGAVVIVDAVADGWVTFTRPDGTTGRSPVAAFTPLPVHQEDT